MNKRLVICCDGTWNRPDTANVTNVEKIARTIETDLTRTGGVQQLVLYLSGVGSSGYFVDQVLGGAFGFGLFNNIRAGYRFLALNYDPGDEIFVFGFSRGAYTARSLVGMVGRVGLLTREALVADQLPEAVARYRAGADGAAAFARTPQDFRTAYCHRDVSVRLLGVFDTVGALGVPGAIRKKHQFHDVNLGPVVTCARQALAMDERRITFEPCLWEAPEEQRVADESSGRVQQVWFPGVHSDVGGGYPVCGLSDTTLLWMASQARECGLVFDERLLEVYVDCGKPADPNDSLTMMYRVLNAISDVRMRCTGTRRSFVRGWRRLDPPPVRPVPQRAVGVKVASTAVQRFHQDIGYRHPNLVELADATGKLDPWQLEVVPRPRQAVSRQPVPRQRSGGPVLTSQPESVGGSGQGDPGPQADRQGVDAVDQGVLPEGQLVGGHGEVGEPSREGRERRTQLHPGQLGADAPVEAVPEREV
jgi:hypothetical protein